MLVIYLSILLFWELFPLLGCSFPFCWLFFLVWDSSRFVAMMTILLTMFLQLTQIDCNAVETGYRIHMD